MKIGVFDSGIGGEKIALLIAKTYPRADVIAVSDKENLPYGNKTKEELKKLVLPKLVSMQQSGCDVIVIACNTVTTLLISEIRDILNVIVIGFEPMIKPAATLTKSNVIAVCATPATLASPRYKKLKEDYARNITIIEPDYSDWARLIENNEITTQQIDGPIHAALGQGADVIVLGCTHYHWIEKEIKQLAQGKAIVIQPEKAILKRLQSILKI